MNCFDTLPSEITNHVLSFLEPEDLYILLFVDKKFNMESIALASPEIIKKIQMTICEKACGQERAFGYSRVG